MPKQLDLIRRSAPLDRLVTDAGIRSGTTSSTSTCRPGAQFPSVLFSVPTVPVELRRVSTASSPTGRLGVPRSRPQCIIGTRRRRLVRPRRLPRSRSASLRYLASRLDHAARDTPLVHGMFPNVCSTHPTCQLGRWWYSIHYCPTFSAPQRISGLGNPVEGVVNRSTSGPQVAGNVASGAGFQLRRTNFKVGRAGRRHPQLPEPRFVRPGSVSPCRCCLIHRQICHRDLSGWQSSSVVLFVVAPPRFLVASVPG